MFSALFRHFPLDPSTWCSWADPLLYFYGYWYFIWSCELLFLSWRDSDLFNQPISPQNKTSKFKSTTYPFWVGWIHIFFILSHNQHSGGIPQGKTGRFLCILKPFHISSSSGDISLCPQKKQKNNRSSSEISQVWSNFRWISADISLKLLQTWQLARPLPPAQRLWINVVWHHGQIPRLHLIHLRRWAETCPTGAPPSSSKRVPLSIWIKVDMMWHSWELLMRWGYR